MANVVHWYLCPYDVENAVTFIRRGTAINRYIEGVEIHPGPDDLNYAFSETLGNHNLVKVSAPQALHDTIQADSDFTLLPTDREIIEGRLQNALRAKIVDLGFTGKEVDDTLFVADKVIDLLLSTTPNWRANAAFNGVDILPGRRPGKKTRADIDRKL